VKFLLTSTSGEVQERVIELDTLDALMGVVQSEEVKASEIILRKPWYVEKQRHEDVEWALEIYDDYRE
jgi:hypothetical protein